MPSIKFREVDNTVEELNVSNTDVVFIPGFLSTDSDAGVTVSPMTPKLCTSIATFESYFGTKSAVFTGDQAYTGFGTGIVPSGAKMYLEGDEDLSYILAKELLAKGLPVLYVGVNSIDEGQMQDPSVGDMYDALTGTESVESVFDIIADMNTFPIKYITSGGYPTFEYVGSSQGGNVICEKMIALASTRTDCVALIDAINNPDRTLVKTNSGSVYYSATNTSSPYKIGTNGDYAAIMNPTWVEVTLPVVSRTKEIPPSFAYLLSLGNSISQGNANFLSIAGITRGVVPGFVKLCTNHVLTKAISDSYSDDENTICINSITEIRPTLNAQSSVACFWSNRTLKSNTEGLTATSFLDIRNMISDIKKLCMVTALRYTFEHNNDILQIKFKNAIAPTLDNMVNGHGISRYSVSFTKNGNTGLNVIITIYPVYDVEKFEIVTKLENDAN